jgi:hypothetical protein
MLFLPTIFISNLFELFFRPKNTVYLPLRIALSRHRSASASIQHLCHRPRERGYCAIAMAGMTELNPHPRDRGYGIRLRHGGYGTRLRHEDQGTPPMPFFVHYFYFKFV